MLRPGSEDMRKVQSFDIYPIIHKIEKYMGLRAEVQGLEFEERLLLNGSDGPFAPAVAEQISRFLIVPRL